MQYGLRPCIRVILQVIISWILFFPEYQDLFKNRVELLLKSGNPQAVRITINDNTDKIHSLFLYLTINEPKGEELRIRIRFIDFEELLHQLFPRLVKDADIFDPSGSNSLSLVYELDNQGRFLKVNKTFEDVLGYKASEVIGLKYDTFIHPSEKPDHILEFKDLTKNKNLSIKNYRIRHKSGYWKNFNCTSFLSVRENGEKSMVIISDEILNGLHSEAEIKKVKLYQDIIFNHLQGMDVLLIDKNMRFLYSAGHEKNRFNLSDEDFTGKSFHEVLTPRVRKTLLPVLEAALEGRSLSKVNRYSGQIFEIFASPVKNQNGEILAVAVTIKNITRDKADQAQLRKAKREAVAADKAKSLFLASMSHEIRTPLNTIIGFANQLSKTGLATEQKKYVRLIQDSSDQLINVVNELLIIFKIGMGKVFIDKKPFIVREIFNEIGEILRPEAENKKIRFELSVSKDVPKMIVGDPFRVKQVLMNITGNALKYTEHGFVRLSCDVAEDKKRKVILAFTVEDTGIGIPAGELPYIFDEFRQAQNLKDKQRNGTGLGLTISKKLVELQKGKIHVKSILNKGTTFTVKQPFLKSNRKIIPVIQNSYNLKQKLLAGKRLLLVDDDEQNLMLADVLFREWGLHYDTTSNAYDGFELSGINKYDIIMLDIHMPKISGMELMRMIRQDPKNPNRETKMITITANILQSDLKKYLHSGFDSYILKPFREHELYNKICSILNIRKETAETEMQNELSEHFEETDYNHLNYSLSDLKSAAKGDRDFINRMILTFFKNTRNSVSIIENSLAEKNWKEIGEAAHKMITAFRYFKCQKIVENLLAIENKSLYTGEFTSIPELVNETIPLIDKTLKKINKEFNFQTI